MLFDLNEIEDSELVPLEISRAIPQFDAPKTESGESGAVVPIPTLPDESIRIFSVIVPPRAVTNAKSI